jgi:hypothetical protein
MSSDILIRCFPSQGDFDLLFPCGYEYSKMALLMLAKIAHMIVEHHYPFDRFGCTPCALLSPGPDTGHNSEEEKNEKSKVLVCFYPMY